MSTIIRNNKKDEELQHTSAQLSDDRSQYQNRMSSLLSQIENRPDFRYDADGDALYQQYKDRYIHNGQRAMQDTMGQATALTGGYGSSYAQNVGQQAYNEYMTGLNDVIPELYQLAYGRYQDQGERLYQNYQILAQLEKETANREQWEREYALEEQKRQDALDELDRKYALEEQKRQDALEQLDRQYAWEELKRQDALEQLDRQYAWEELKRQDSLAQLEREYALEEQKRQDANSRFEMEYESKNDKGTTTAENLPDYYAWLSTYQKKGERPNYDDPTVTTQYDNKKVSTGNIMLMQRVLGLPETGMWTVNDRRAAGSMEADEAWMAYQKGQLQNRNHRALGDQGVLTANVKSMERVLGLKEDGYWSKADQEAAGGMSEDKAWEAYQRGQLQVWR